MSVHRDAKSSRSQARRRFHMTVTCAWTSVEESPLKGDFSECVFAFAGGWTESVFLTSALDETEDEPRGGYSS